MKQTTLDDFIKRERKPKSWLPVFTCSCGKTFTTKKGLCIHMANTKNHRENPPLVYPNEGISVATNGSLTELRVKMKKKLWEALVKKAQEENIQITEFIFDILVNATVYGREPWTNKNETKYIS